MFVSKCQAISQAQLAQLAHQPPRVPAQFFDVPTPSFPLPPRLSPLLCDLSLPFPFGLPPSSTRISSSSSAFDDLGVKIKLFKNLFSCSNSLILFSNLCNSSLFSRLCLSKLCSLFFFLALNLALAAVFLNRFNSASFSVSVADAEADVCV